MVDMIHLHGDFRVVHQLYGDNVTVTIANVD